MARTASTTTSSTRVSTVAVVASIAAATSTAAAALLWMQYRRHDQEVDEEKERLVVQWKQRREEERRGRIRAEVKLRTLVKQQQQEQQQASQQQHVDHDNTKNKKGNVTTPTPTPTTQTKLIQIIGTVVSPYAKRVGTPRQPQLVPSSRGYIEFVSSIAPAASLDGITAYSHIWIIFEFHANTNITNKRTKIRPPRAAGNIKIGQLATRSPHRPNPIGLSLVCVDRYDPQTNRLHITGLDLVHGTPVYDIKPCVPWDLPGYPYHEAANSLVLDNYGDDGGDRGGTDSGSSNNNALKPSQGVLRVPEWVVRTDDTFDVVEFTSTAAQQIATHVTNGRFAPLYLDSNDGCAAIKQTIKEILVQDPRSSHRGGVDAMTVKNGGRRGTRGAAGSNNTTTTSTTDDGVLPSYNLILGQCHVDFVVTGNDKIIVQQVIAVEFDDSVYVEGIPLMNL